MLLSEWKDYELIDTSNGEKLERWGKYVLLRPDPSIIWDNGNLLDKNKNDIDAYYTRSHTGGGAWTNLKKIPASWTVSYKDLVFNVKQMGFKHTGLFPEQSVNWEFYLDKISKSSRPIKVLNLFAYTGAATVACLKAGAMVTHVDSSRGMTDWAKENVRINKLDETKVRYIVDDVVKFVSREIRRGNKYDAIIMDPPSYGRGANKEVWDIEKDLFNLVKLCTEILSDKPLFFVINTYTTALSKEVFNNILKITINKYKGTINSYEIGLKDKNGFILPCGIVSRWEGDN